ncbi:MAG: site-2 protease family protein [Gaiellales bacterium]
MTTTPDDPAADETRYPTTFEELDAQFGPAPPPEPQRHGVLQKLLAPLVALGLLALKFGAFALKFFGIFIAVGGYALIWGWTFAVGFVLCILVHELGHYVEAKREGLDPKLPVFIPFLGAYVMMRNRFDPWANARISLAGPIAGGVAAIACLAIGELTDSRFWTALAYTGCLINLFNLVPVGFLDGGQTLKAWRVLRAGGGRATVEDARRLSFVVAALGIGTAAVLALGMVVAHVPQNRL